MVDNIGAGIDGQGLEGTIDGARGGVGEWNVDKEERWEWVARNSLTVRRLSSRVRNVSSLQVRDPVESS